METLEQQFVNVYFKIISSPNDANFFGSTKKVCSYLKEQTGYSFEEKRVSIALLKSNAIRIKTKTNKGVVSLWALKESDLPF